MCERERREVNKEKDRLTRLETILENIVLVQNTDECESMEGKVMCDGENTHTHTYRGKASRT